MRVTRHARVLKSDKALEQTTHRAIGCYMLPAAKIGDFTAQTVDDLSDTLAEKINFYDTQERNQKIIEQDHKVANLEVNNLTQEDILKLAHDFVAEAMFSENFYIALYDHVENLLTFPLIYKNGELWQVPSREIDPKKLGKTEAIIQTKSSLLHYSRDESKAWYKLSNHAEHGGDPLASWIGVPIFLDNEVIGVIATFHPTLDWVYTKQDQFFLESVAVQISGLFRALKLSESIHNNTELRDANRKLGEAQNTILQHESAHTLSALSHDLIHRSHNTFGALSINISEAIESIALENKNAEAISYLKDAIKEVEGILQDIKEISNPRMEEIDVFEVIEQVRNSVITHKNNKKIKIKIKSGKNIMINAIKTNLFNIFHSVIDNAADAIIHSNKENLFIEVSVMQKDRRIIITVSDNGIDIPPAIENGLFQLGTSRKENNGGGYGLWRAKLLAKALKGDIQYEKEKDNLYGIIKIFTISLPAIFKEKPLCIIIDDEESWRNIVSRWMEKINYDIKKASNIDEINGLLSNCHDNLLIPKLIFLDISFDRKSSFDTSGLSVISKIRRFFHSAETKIILLTGYSNRAANYIDRVDLIIEKVSGDSPLTRQIFIEKLTKSSLIE